ncbi:Gfo/Idh/MocA family protein [Priestia megaterium]|uniref:Gfo/Idh/MocA family protein n=1 Tax=Priestia megaterium TaxID=1404 RepID=UPI00398FAE45
MKVGVIGAGNMGENHVRAYASLVDYCQLIGLYDTNKERGNEIANRYHINQFDSLNELLEAVDIVSIAVPTEYHYEIGLACIKHGVHMLMEKPIASNVIQAKILTEKAKKAKVKLQVGHIELYNPIINLLKNILDNEEIIAVDVHRMNSYNSKLLNVDIVQDLMIHDIYILRKLLDDKIINFYAIGNHIHKHVVVIAEFEKGIIAQLTASFKSEEKTRTIRVITEKALIRVNLLDEKIEIIRRPSTCHMKNETDYHPEKIIESIDISNKNPLKTQLIDFINCVKNDTTPLVTGEDGIKALTICSKISEFIKKSSIV